MTLQYVSYDAELRQFNWSTGHLQLVDGRQAIVEYFKYVLNVIYEQSQHLDIEVIKSDIDTAMQTFFETFTGNYEYESIEVNEIARGEVQAFLTFRETQSGNSETISETTG